MKVYRKEIRNHLRSLLLWSLGMLFFIAASAGKYSAMAGDPAALGIFTQLPMGLQAVFGVGRLDFTKAIGFYGVLYPYLTLMAAIHASMLGAVILSKEERDQTSEFLYVKPRSRVSVLTSKLLAALTMVVLLNLITWASSVGMVRAFGEQADGLIARLMVGLFLLQLVFLACGLAAAAVSTHPRAATGIAAGVMLGTYVLSVAIEVNGGIDWMKIFTPFAYFDAKLIVGGGEPLNLLYILLCAALTAGLTGWAYLRFPRRDVRVQRGFDNQPRRGRGDGWEHAAPLRLRKRLHPCHVAVPVLFALTRKRVRAIVCNRWFRYRTRNRRLWSPRMTDISEEVPL